MLGALHQQTARMHVAALGDRSLAAPVTGRFFARHQAQIRHHLPRMGKSIQRSQFAHHDHGRHRLEAFHRHERAHRRLMNSKHTAFLSTAGACSLTQRPQP
jgi:hypothetical protein